MSHPAWGPPAPAPRHATRQEAAAAPGTSGNARRTPRRTARRSTPDQQAAGRTSAAASAVRRFHRVARLRPVQVHRAPLRRPAERHIRLPVHVIERDDALPAGLLLHIAAPRLITRAAIREWQ